MWIKMSCDMMHSSFLSFWMFSFNRLASNGSSLIPFCLALELRRDQLRESNYNAGKMDHTSSSF